MPILRPFRGLRYSEKAGPLGDLICPLESAPDPTWYENPCQAIHLVSPKRESDDRSKYVAFARAMAALAFWRREGILELESEPSWYRWKAGEGSIWIGLARIADLPEQAADRRILEGRLRRLEATRLHPEFPTYRADAEPAVLSEAPIHEGFSRVRLAEPWSPNLQFVDGAAALEAARAHAASMGQRVAGKAEEWLPIAVLTGTLGPVSGLSLFTEAQIGDHSGSGAAIDGVEADSQENDLMHESQPDRGILSWPSHWAGWLFWCHGDHLREDPPA